MRAAVLHGPRDLRFESVADPAPEPGDVLLRVTGNGVCGSDAAFYVRGQDALPAHERHVWPLILGHELAGVVLETPPESDLQVGDLVACGAGIACGTCDRCLRGRTNLCRTYRTAGASLHGGLAELAAVPAGICLRAAEFGVTGDDAALAQPMSVACHAVARSGAVEGDRVLIIGAGGIGAFTIWAAVQTGCEVSVCDTNASRIPLARALGAAQAVALAPGESPADVFADAERFHQVLDTSGAEASLAAALTLVDRGGAIVLIGMHGQPRPVDLGFVTHHEIALLGTHAHVVGQDLSRALTMLGARREGWADVAPSVLPLDDVVDDALEPLARGQSPRVKTIIDPAATTARDYRR